MRCPASLVLLLLACTPSRSREWLDDSTRARTSFPLSTDGGIPATLDDGLSADEAVAVAFTSSPALRAELTQLESALATLDEAHRPANPRINNALAPIDPRQLAFVLFVPIESIWQMPSRIQASTAELESTAEQLVQLALELDRAVRIAHADASLAERRVDVLQLTSTAWADAAALAQSRATAGDIAPAEAEQVRAEATLALDAVQRASHELTIARVRLLTLLGAPWPELPQLADSSTIDRPLASLGELHELALAQRPDLTAAKLSVNAAAARASWERSRVFSIFLSIDGQAPVGGLVPQWAPGLQAELPIFSQNQGGIGRADAAVMRATHRYAATRISVLQDVVFARESVERARTSRVAVRSVRASLELAASAATRAFENGSDSYLVVVDALRRVTDARLRELELEAEVLRADAELDRAVGGRSLINAEAK